MAAGMILSVSLPVYFLIVQVLALNSKSLAAVGVFGVSVVGAAPRAGSARLNIMDRHRIRPNMLRKGFL